MGERRRLFGGLEGGVRGRRGGGRGRWFGEVGGSGTDRPTRRISSLRRRRVWRGVVEGGGGRRW